jgi:molybdopterin/thiamine biosynthesis adenylyltransferase
MDSGESHTPCGKERDTRMRGGGRDTPAASLTELDLVRYSRQIIFPAFGEEGQLKLRQAHVLIAGVGGLGSPCAIYLACAGIGRLTLVDSDSVELSNLNRQILHGEEDIGEPKVISAVGKLKKLNSTLELNPVAVRITAESLPALLSRADLVIDCLDAMETRFILNEGCVRAGKPFIHQDVEGKKPFPVFGCTAALVASLQVMEAIKLLSGFGDLLTGKMLYVSGETMACSTVLLQRNTECEICGGGNI